MSGCPDKDIHSIYIDGELPEKYRAEYEAHVNSCEKCKIELQKMRKISELIKADSRSVNLGDAFLEDSFARLQTKLRYAKNTKGASKKSKVAVYQNVTRWAVSFVAAAAVFAMIFIPLQKREDARNSAQLSVIQRASPEIKPIVENNLIIEGNLDPQAIAYSSQANQHKTEREQDSLGDAEQPQNQRVIFATNLASSSSNLIRSLGSIDVFRPDFQHQDEHR